jgi:hypothetical protein
MPARYARIKEAAEFLGITETALRRRVAKRQIPFISDHGIFFDLKELEHFRTKRRVPTLQEALRNAA